MSIESLPYTLLLLLGQFAAGVAALVFYTQLRGKFEPAFIRTCSWLTISAALLTTLTAFALDPRPNIEGFRLDQDVLQPVQAISLAMLLFSFVHQYFLRRDDEAYIPQPSDVRALVCSVMYGYEDEVKPAGKRLFRIAKEHGARYLGDEISEGDWAARHDRYATPLHGRTKTGQVVPMSWHCEDAAVNYTRLPSVTKAWHEIVADLRRKTDVFDDWGMFAYTSANTGVDYLTEIESFREQYRRECFQSGIDYVALDTSMPFDKALTEYLAMRRSRAIVRFCTWQAAQPIWLKTLKPTCVAAVCR